MRLNGMVDGQPVIKKRRGRRKNVEGMDHLFMNKYRLTATPDQVRGPTMLREHTVLMYRRWHGNNQTISGIVSVIFTFC